MKFYPHKYQERAIDFLVETDQAALFMDMGLGKTATVLSAFDRLKYNEGKVQSMIVVAPLRVALLVWAQEAKKWDHLQHLRVQVLHGDLKVETLDKKADIYVINYDGLKWFARQMQKRRLPQRVDMVALDESTQIKNHKAIRSQVAIGMSMSVKRRVIMTGSPTPNSLLDIWNQIRALDMGKRLGTSFYQFRNGNFFQPEQARKWVPFRGAQQRITDRIADIALTMKAEDYLDMPDRIDNKIEVELPEKHRQQYTDFENDFFLQVEERGVEVFNAAALAIKLRQFVQGFVYDPETQEALDIHDCKVQALREIVDGSSSPVLVAIQFRHDYELIKKEFGDVPVIYGGTSTKDTIAHVEAWNAGLLPMLVAHPASLAHGVNLQSGGYTVAWFGLSFNLEHYIQFNARLYRQGQTHPVMVHHLIMKNTIDEVVMDAIEHKESVMAKLLNRLKEWRAKIGHQMEAA